MFEVYHFTYKTAHGIKKRGTITAMSITDARFSFEHMARIDNNEYFDCELLRVWLPKPPTEKQKLAQKYGFIMGSIKSAQVGTRQAGIGFQKLSNDKRIRAANLVESQFAKLQRDVADLFRLAGLKIK